MQRIRFNSNIPAAHSRFPGQPITDKNRPVALLPNPDMSPKSSNNKKASNHNSHFNNQNRHKPNYSNVKVSHKYDINRKPSTQGRIIRHDKYNRVTQRKDMPESTILSITNYPSSIGEVHLIYVFGAVEGFKELLQHSHKRGVTFAFFNNVESAKEGLSLGKGYPITYEHRLNVEFSDYETFYSTSN